MADLETQQLDMNQLLLELERPIATPYFEDYLFRIFTDLIAINNEITSGGITDGENLGAGAEVFAQKDDTILQFRTLIGDGVTINQTDDELEFVVEGFIDDGTITNSILTWNEGIEAWTELTEFLVSWAAGVATIQVENDIGGLVTGITIDADGQVGLYFDGSETVQTRDNSEGGLFVDNQDTGGGFERVLTTSDAGGGENVDDGTVANTILTWDGTDTWTEFLNFLVASGTVDQFLTSATAVTYTMRNSQGGSQFHVDNGDGRFRIFQTTSGGALEDVWLNATRNAQVALYYNNVLAFQTTTSGAEIHPSTAAGDATLRFQDASGDTCYIEKSNAFNVGVLYNEQNGFGWVIQADDAGGTGVNMFVCDPDGSCDLYHDAVLRAQTDAVGWNILGAATTDCQVRLLGSSGLFLGALFATSTALTLRNGADGQLLVLDADDGGGTTQNLFVGDPDGAVDLYHDGTHTVQTVAVADGGLEVDNQDTGSGFERVLTTSDLGGAAQADLIQVTAAYTIDVLDEYFATYNVTAEPADITIEVDPSGLTGAATFRVFNQSGGDIDVVEGTSVTINHAGGGDGDFPVSDGDVAFFTRVDDDEWVAGKITGA